ncbi:hypothetical protein BCR44DRAFT_1434033 [Catenaria anguillulae PL171]|uniref:Uncharacterized protein n=1 Tax=Catenaria anguillulae PL171 TaxID=765915 RepID=A0A1Y2HM64_9FUNG|nr:hypothetical protein BCR44DRAFT_1434033 [Catenaria anguillulae PL171]
MNQKKCQCRSFNSGSTSCPCPAHAHLVSCVNHHLLTLGHSCNCYFIPGSPSQSSLLFYPCGFAGILLETGVFNRHDLTTHELWNGIDGTVSALNEFTV